MKKNVLNGLLFFLIFLCIAPGFRAQITAARNNNLDDDSDLINNAYEAHDWRRLEKLQKQQFFIDQNPSRLIWSARCCIWLNDTVGAYSYLDTAIKCGYANIYVLDTDTAFADLRHTARWQEIRREIGEKYKIKERVFFWGYYYGVLAIIFVLNLFLFYSTKEYSYLFLSLMIVADMHLELFNNSSAKIFATRIVPWLSTVMANRYPPPTFYVGSLMVFYLLFTKSFLRVRDTFPRLVVVYRAFIGVFISIIIIRFYWGLLPDSIIEGLVATSFLLAVVTSIVQIQKKLNQSLYFVTAAVVITLGFFLNDSFVVISYSPLSVGMLIAFTVLTLGTANKIKVMRLEKERAQEKAMLLLEAKVAERTAEVVKQKDEIEAQKNMVEEKQMEILDSINYAKRLQQAILPPQEFINSYMPDNFVLYRPKDIVAGDFYWADEINDHFYIAAGDSTGHGVPGALVSVVCCNALNRSVKEFGLTETGKILDKTKELVVETFEKSHTDVKDGMDISLLCINLKSKGVTWSGANNPLWYVQNRKLHVIKPDKQPIGKTDFSTPYTTHSMEYSINTIFYLFTDGYADQFGGEKGKKFNYKQFETLLVSVQDSPMQEQLSVINARFVNWKGDLEQVDDVCVIGLRL